MINDYDNHILIVDDDDKIRELLKDFLISNNFLVSTAINGEDAIKKIELINFDILILDIMMPGIDGYELTKIIRLKSLVPIIHLTAMGDTNNVIQGLELGADDYLSKPFEPKELLLRVKNILKKNKSLNIKKILLIGGAKIDLNKMTINLNNKNKKLNIAEKKILTEMLSDPGKIFSRAQIGKISNLSQERSIDVMITRLRQKIEINPKNPKYLQTLRGVGYVLWIK